MSEAIVYNSWVSYSDNIWGNNVTHYASRAGSRVLLKAGHVVCSMRTVKVEQTGPVLSHYVHHHDIYVHTELLLKAEKYSKYRPRIYIFHVETN